MAMSTGELNSDSFFRYRDKSDITGLPFPGATVLLWIIFVVLMTILLTNMLVWHAWMNGFNPFPVHSIFLIRLDWQLEISELCIRKQN